MQRIDQMAQSPCRTSNHDHVTAMGIIGIIFHDVVREKRNMFLNREPRAKIQFWMDRDCCAPAFYVDLTGVHNLRKFPTEFTHIARMIHPRLDQVQPLDDRITDRRMFGNRLRARIGRRRTLGGHETRLSWWPDEFGRQGNVIGMTRDPVFRPGRAVGDEDEIEHEIFGQSADLHGLRDRFRLKYLSFR